MAGGKPVYCIVGAEKCRQGKHLRFVEIYDELAILMVCIDGRFCGTSEATLEQQTGLGFAFRF